MLDKITELSLKMRGLVIIALLAVVAYGIFAYRNMPVDAFPDISPVMVPVFVEAHGMAPEEVERLVTFPIESAMNGLPGVTQIKSTSAFGMAVIYVYFHDRVDMYFARQLVAERLNSSLAELPDLGEPPTLGPISTGLGQIFMYYLTMDETVDTEGKDPDTYLRELNDWQVKAQLRTVPGVTDILSIGGHVLQYQIRLDPAAMLKYDLTLTDIVDAVERNNRNVGGQFLVLDAEETLVRGLGLVQTLDDIRSIPLKSTGGVAVYISDVADVVYGNEIRRGVVTRNGEEEVVSGIVLKLYGENTSQVIKHLYDKVDVVQASLPRGVRLVPYYEQSELVQQAAWTVTKALLQGAFLVLLTLLLFLGNVRTALIVAVSLPVCSLIAVIFMGLSGISANLMSLGGIAIAIGMLGDGSIVMVENIYRHLTGGNEPAGDPRARIASAAREVSRPIVFSIFIIVAVFLPLFTLEGTEGKMFSPMAFTISFALLGSAVTALVVTPVLASLLLAPRVTKEMALLRLLKKAYSPFLNASIRHAGVVLGVALAVFAATLLLVPKLGTEFIPTLEEGSILIGVTMAPSISLERATETIKMLERQIRKHPEVVETVSRIGRPESGSHPHPVNYAEIHLALKPLEEWPPDRRKEMLVEELTHELETVPGIQLNFSQPIQNAFDELLSGIKSQLSIEVYGEDLAVLREKAGEIEAVLENVPGLVDLAVEQNFGQPQVQIIPDRQACARLGVPLDHLLEVVELAIGGEVIGQIYQNMRRFGIHVRLQEPYRAEPEAIRRILIPTDTGGRIPLSQVATVEHVVGPIQVNRENNNRRWVVQANVRGRDLGSVVSDIKAIVASRVTLPEGYWVEYGGQFENQQRAMRRLAIIVPVVLAAVFLLLWMAFGTAREALIILFNVPLALIGGVLGLYFSGEYLSVPASVGFIALFGIAVQNGVVLVSYFDELRKSGHTKIAAVQEGALLRLRPVLMTASTTMLGLLPLLMARGIGSEVQRPLAVVVVFGLGTSTLLTLFVIPAAYAWFGPRLK
ncbi:MAG TPA: CusA/CzcA family heavy metal efflux RND transporter [Candidatus Hydrogenedentes bacterium]|nr:CusA/CzcA family heavy metal efflux RND transporter [Candidatus Hydrogenedentota bacterium]HPJ98241.1 CusA/CzcA family heavy metal efflux RND transporter [Candidatus Hydrogenedentota bacterium]